jgi:hypothetical protein
LCTSAVAKRRLGATSSATTSTIERFSPASVSQLRCSSRPLTTTRAPLVSDAPTFSASCRQATTLKKLVCSSHSWVCWFRQERFTATPKVTFETPLGVYRISGSRVMLPEIVMLLVSVAMSLLPMPAAR